MTNYLFNSITESGYVMKILIDLLKSNLHEANFEIDTTGIKLCMMDSNRSILIDLFLDASKFSLYRFMKC